MCNSKYCKRCGCYIPDNINECLACGYEIKDSTKEIYFNLNRPYIKLEEKPIEFYSCKNCREYLNGECYFISRKIPKKVMEDDVCDNFFRKELNFIIENKN